MISFCRELPKLNVVRSLVTSSYGVFEREAGIDTTLLYLQLSIIVETITGRMLAVYSSGLNDVFGTRSRNRYGLWYFQLSLLSKLLLAERWQYIVSV